MSGPDHWMPRILSQREKCDIWHWLGVWMEVKVSVVMFPIFEFSSILTASSCAPRRHEFRDVKHSSLAWLVQKLRTKRILQPRATSKGCSRPPKFDLGSASVWTKNPQGASILTALGSKCISFRWGIRKWTRNPSKMHARSPKFVKFASWKEQKSFHSQHLPKAEMATQNSSLLDSKWGHLVTRLLNHLQGFPRPNLASTSNKIDVFSKLSHKNGTPIHGFRKSRRFQWCNRFSPRTNGSDAIKRERHTWRTSLFQQMTPIASRKSGVLTIFVCFENSSHFNRNLWRNSHATSTKIVPLRKCTFLPQFSAFFKQISFQGLYSNSNLKMQFIFKGQIFFSLLRESQSCCHLQDLLDVHLELPHFWPLQNSFPAFEWISSIF